MGKEKKSPFCKESGSSGPLVYAMSFVALVMAIYFFTMMEYRAKIHMLKDDMETNLHVIENYCLTVNQKKDSGEDKFERERERAHIITAKDNDGRLEQAEAIGRAFEERFKAEFMLDGCKPYGGVLTQMTNHASENALSEMHIKTLTIFEPTYERGEVYPVYCGNYDRDGNYNQDHIHEEDCKDPDKCPLPDIATFNGLSETERKRWTSDGMYLDISRGNYRVPYDFLTITETIGWREYTLYFDENNAFDHVEISEELPSPPKVMGSVLGHEYAEGATIQATISAKFKRPFGFWGEYVLGDNPEKDEFEGDNDREFQYVYVREGIDIVYSSEDSRKGMK